MGRRRNVAFWGGKQTQHVGGGNDRQILNIISKAGRTEFLDPSHRSGRICGMTMGKHSGALHAFFYLGLSLLVCHELDAVFRHEWRILPGLSLLPDDPARTLFVIIHVPVFVLLFSLTGHVSDIIRKRSQFGVDAFLIGHALVHFVMSGHELYDFEPPVETITVYGGALVGFIHAVCCLKMNDPK